MSTEAQNYNNKKYEYDDLNKSIYNSDISKAKSVVNRYLLAKENHDMWLNIWEECYEYALPQRVGFYSDAAIKQPGSKKLYDATAVGAAEQLAASLLGNLTPIWSSWFGLKPGPDLTDAEADALAPVLEKASQTIQAHFDRSNFAVEIHQCYLDLVVGGTAALSFEEADIGDFSAFKFSAIPLSQIVMEEGENARLDNCYRIIPMTLDQLMSRYVDIASDIPAEIIKKSSQNPQTRFDILEAIIPNGLVYDYIVLLIDNIDQPVILKSGTFSQSPIIGFRWLKSPNETYGRSPVMKALPDIKTVNKVVELILKNASIAVTGIWQADDDGVLNPANISLIPGTIIPKAVDSKGLQPLEMPSRFDVSQLMLENLQNNIRHALLTDKFAPITNTPMSATEVLERVAEMSLILGATYGRLQSELLTPLIQRAFSILQRRGEVPDISLDGRLVAVDYRSPLARAQGQRNIQNTLSWLNTVFTMGDQAISNIDIPAAIRFLGDALAVPSNLMRSETISELSVKSEEPNETFVN